MRKTSRTIARTLCLCRLGLKRNPKRHKAALMAASADRKYKGAESSGKTLPGT